MKEWETRIISVCMVLLLCFTVIACGAKQKNDPLEKLKDLEFSVIAEDNLPEELHTMIEEKRESSFKMTFQDQGFLYICVGYGQQQSGGYSIAVNELYETSNAIYIDTNLIGPSADEKKHSSPSYPFVVVKTEFIDKPVVFD